METACAGHAKVIIAPSETGLPKNVTIPWVFASGLCGAQPPTQRMQKNIKKHFNNLSLSIGMG
jgi:hypothetical protein